MPLDADAPLAAPVPSTGSAKTKGKAKTKAKAKAKATSSAKPASRPTRAPAPHRPKGLSLHIGLNAVNPARYGGWSGPLTACEFDAQDMAALARSRQIEPTLLLTREATRDTVLSCLSRAARTLVAGDLFVLSYSGHGGQMPDVDHEEADGMDETWCLYDGQLIDDELYAALGAFVTGVRVLVLSDSCHSGTVTREAPVAEPSLSARPRWMPAPVAMRVYREHQAFYDKLQAQATQQLAQLIDPDAALARLNHGLRIDALTQPLRAAVVLISGCQDNQTSMDGQHNGAFTEQLLRVWNHGRFRGSLTQFQQRILAGMPPSQSPNLYALGPATSFLLQAPFQV